jgi:hypothetical protein
MRPMGVRVAAWRGLWPAAGLALLVACGGGGSNGTGAFPEGSGTGGFSGGGSGTPPFSGGGSGTPPFGSGSGGGAGATGDGPRPSPDAVVVVSNDDIQGSVLSGASGAPVAAAAVRFSATTLTTDSEGLFSQADSGAIPRLVIEGDASGFEPLYSVTEVLGTVPSVSILRLTPFGVTSTVTVASGGTVTDTATPASVAVPANALVAAGGGAAPTTVDLRVTAVNVGSDSNLLSGDYTDSNGVPVQAFGAATVTSSVAVDVVSGQQLALQIPLSTRSAVAPASASLYFLDASTGRWVQDGSATLVSGTPSYYQANVTRFGQWMVGSPITAAVSVTGCVVDDNDAPAASVRMAGDGVNYSSINSATTNASGQFTVVAPANSSLVIQGRRGAFLTNAVSIDVGASAVSIPTCLTIPTTNAATMRLTWGEYPRDIDSHLHVPGGYHVYYVTRGSLGAEPFANLDVDDVTGFGPEVTTIRRPKIGIYRFYLHNFSQTFSPGMTGSPTRVELNYAGRTVVFSPPTGEGSALYWHLFDLEIAADCSMTLYRYNRWRADEPQNPNAAGAATECTPS